MKRSMKSGDILTKYKAYLKLEKSLSSNTVDAYLRDLDKLKDFAEELNISLTDVTLDHLENFSASLHDCGI